VPSSRTALSRAVWLFPDPIDPPCTGVRLLIKWEEEKKEFTGPDGIDNESQNRKG
jgi:hypothetical protein